MVLATALIGKQFGVTACLLTISVVSAGVAAGLILGIFEPAAIRLDSTNFTPALVFVCGVFGVVGFAIRLWSIGQALSVPVPSVGRISGSSGASMLAFAASAHLAFTAVDHWWFYRGAATGIASPMAMGVKDVACSQAVFRVEGSDAVYRCPKWMMFNQRYAKPFVPWPDYVSGHSKVLKDKYDELMKVAQ
ncbi:MAG TPA: hypothetical protein VGN07_15785 [Steroidobacteraceae bacterium]